MKRIAGRIVVVLFSLFIASPVAHADLTSDVRAVLQDKLLSRAEVGVQIVRLGSSENSSTILFKHNSDIPLVPASNLKIVTTSAAIDRLGADFKFRTQLILHDGDVILVGDGDPTLGDAEMLKKVGWDVTTVFQTWAAQLKKHGITTVRNVIVDDSIFADDEFLHPNWPSDQVHKRYVAEVGGVNLNANCVDFIVQPIGMGQAVRFSMTPATRYVSLQNTCIGGSENAIWLSRNPGTNEVILRGQARTTTDVPVSVTVHDPPMFAATVMSETFAANGIAVSGRVTRDRTMRQAYQQAAAKKDASWVLLAIHETPIEAVIARANKDSMNVYAEALCKRLGAAVSNAPGSWPTGTAAVGAYLKHIGVPADQFSLDDGCGLSKKNSISAAAMSRVLTYDFFGGNRQQFLSSLAVAGIDGTLEDRFRRTDLRGRVMAKSGFVAGVSALSGYLKGKDDQWYVFSILMNGIPEGSNSSIKPLQERIVKAIDSNSGELAVGR